MAETMINEKLELGFGTAANTKTNVNLQSPKADLTAEVVMTAMETMAGKGVLMDSKGNLVTDVLSARIVRTLEDVLF
mgnify:FL=1